MEENNMAKEQVLNLPYIKIKDLYIKKDTINFFYFDDNVLYVGVNGNILTVEFDRKKDDIKGLERVMDSLFKYRELA